MRRSSRSLRTCGLAKGASHPLAHQFPRRLMTEYNRRLDLTAKTRHMGQRKLLKEGTLIKAKSGRKLRAFLCSDTLVLTDDTVKNLYRMVSR